MTAKDYVNMKFAEYEKRKQEKKEIEQFFRCDSLINMTLQYRVCNYQDHKVSVFFFDIPDKLSEKGDSIYYYTILFHTTNYFKKGRFEGTENGLFKMLKEMIINDINNLKL